MLTGALAQLRDQGANLWRMRKISCLLAERNLPLLARLIQDYLLPRRRRPGPQEMTSEEAHSICASFEALGPVFVTDCLKNQSSRDLRF